MREGVAASVACELIPATRTSSPLGETVLVLSVDDVLGCGVGKLWLPDPAAAEGLKKLVAGQHSMHVSWVGLR